MCFFFFSGILLLSVQLRLTISKTENAKTQCGRIVWYILEHCQNNESVNKTDSVKRFTS